MNYPTPKSRRTLFHIKMSDVKRSVTLAGKFAGPAGGYDNGLDRSH